MYPYICDFWKDMETLSTCVIPIYTYTYGISTPF